MSKIFTITEGVENMGAMKSGGQGSVYKGKRIGEIISAIKIIPTPIYSESKDDKNFLSFQNEVEKLKKVNEDANPNVVTILNHGITESGNFPFIEMEYIEGPDLAELLRPPHDPIFTIEESLKVARHLSNALAHCHIVEVKHGDLKSNNVKFNTHTGNYILLDFGLSVMSDEQRRTSFRQAGAIEFMAPEQHKGQLSFESEVYSFGIILFELLCGTVPFALTDNGEAARNTVMVGHLDSLPPNLLSLRQQHLPERWTQLIKEQEMQVPQWLISMIYKCLEKQPANRFSNGMELHEHITRNSMIAAGNIAWGADRIAKLEKENEDWRKEKESLLKELEQATAAGKDTGDGVTTTKKSLVNWKNLLLLVLTGTVAWLAVSNAKQQNLLADVRTVKDSVAITPGVYSPSEEETFQLKKAASFMMNGRMEDARSIYKTLALQEIPEAMHEYGNLTLLNANDKKNCAEGFNYLEKSLARGYTPAKRIVGMLYAFGGDTTALKQLGYYGCDFQYDIPRGAKLLMEAALEGDIAAAKLVDELQGKFSNPAVTR